jgi:deoxyribodipyrimidine photo-lyase
VKRAKPRTRYYPPMIQETRVRELNHEPVAADGKYVLYWMQASQRTRFNFALEYAIGRANELDKPLLVCFGLMDDFPEANERHYAFLLDGLKDVHDGLKERQIKLVVRHGQAYDAAVHFGKQASLIVCDRGYTRHQKNWRDRVADHARRLVVQVESDVVVPVDEVSQKHESAARTIRPKITKLRDEYLVDLKPVKVKHPSLRLPVDGNLDVTQGRAVLAKLKLDRSIQPVDRFTGGETAAHKLLADFLKHDLATYSTRRNDPGEQHSSMMSPYLHYGHMSPVELALAAKKHPDVPAADRDSYLEELIVRRELSMNFCQFEPNYDRYEAIPGWAQKSLSEHRNDKRPYLYTRQQLESAETHDPYWNAAQIEMNRTGFMHNYMRMYWGKKILEWSSSPAEGFDTTLRINNSHFFDGRDPNSFANVSWIYGTHDRPWGPARPIFGLIRYMNSAGLERKFDIDGYVARVAAM